MDEHALGLLEFPRILEEIASLCVSPEGAALLRTQPVAEDAAGRDQVLDLSLAFRAILESGSALPGFDFPEIGQVLAVLGPQGMALDGEELAAVGRWILSALKLKRVVLKTGGRGPLSAVAEEVPDLAPLSRSIFRLLDQEGVLKEKQIPSLAAIRDRIRRNRDDADRSVRGLLDDQANRSYWQTTTPTQRDGRVVLPLKAQFKGRVKGIVHEMSSSGSTIFIEPLEVVEKNNAIVQEENLYRLEMRRILRDLTAEVSARATDLVTMVAKTAFLDAILGRARYAVHHSCRPAELSTDTISLREARHPLLGSRVIPVNVVMGADHRVLIITGPNTGGKTVSLKTVGLLAVMNQFGMEIPSGEGSLLPIFDAVFADIGDEQSIEQSLSTFSAHVKNLSRIVKGVSARSLVLLDELGAGTDPEEGVALAMALLDHFLETGCRVMATTHHGILKNYGATRAGAQNASMGFDRETLGPTYRILMGVPGESHALEIARRSGMPETILSSAFSYLDDERTDISRLVSNLAERHQTLVEAEEIHKSREHELKEKWRRTDLKELTLRQKELELRRHGLKEVRDFLGQARKEWEAMREKAGTAAVPEFTALAARIQDTIEREEQRIEQESEALAPAASFEVREGMDVLIRRTGRRGRVLRKDKGKRWIVETETLRLSLLPGELLPAAQGADLSAASVAVSYAPASPMDPPVLELHLRGMRLEEAMRRLEKQIDNALMSGLREFSVVHGKGEGVLRTAIHEYLRTLPVVADFRFSAPEEGGFGKTIITLKG